MAVVAVRTRGLRVLSYDSELEALRMLVDRREELTRARVQTVNRLQRLLGELTPDNYRSAVEIAELPMLIRGYGHVKSRNLTAVNIRKEILMKQFQGELIPLGNPVAAEQSVEIEDTE